MIGTEYWAVHIVLGFGRHASEEEGLWRAAATMEFYDNGWCEDASTQGELQTRYFIEPTEAVRVVVADARKLGIVFRNDPLPIYVPADGEDPDVSLPADWRRRLEEIAAAVPGTVSGYAER